MKASISTLSKKITLLNQVTLDSVMEKDKLGILKNFTEVGIKILEADFGFAWWRTNKDKEYALAYKSPSIPYEPPQPRAKAGNYIARTTRKPFFDSDVKTANYEFNIRKYLKSYIIIPIFYKDFMYGNLVFCYKKTTIFDKDDETLAGAIGNVAAQAITIYFLLENERQAMILAEKQKEMEILLDQEKVKTEFIANATHELRTPLAIMRGNVDLALGGHETKKLKSPESALKDIKREIDSLSTIITDLATMTAHNGNSKQAVRYEKIELVELLCDTVRRLKVLLGKKGTEVTINTGKIKEIFIDGDRQHLEKLFLNLVRNSTTYGKENGKIIIDLRKEKNKISIEVRDNGIGIPEKDLPHVFERFYRTEEARQITTIGTGLGLAISKWITESHGGNIGAKSIEGKGSTFTVTLPISKA